METVVKLSRDEKLLYIIIISFKLATKAHIKWNV